MSEQAPPGTQVLQRVGTVLRAVANRSRDGVRLIDLLQILPLDRSTLHRILQGLVGEGLLAQDRLSKRYFLGSFAYELGLAASNRIPLGRASQMPLQTVADATGDTVFLIIKAGLDGLCIDRREGAWPVKVFLFTPGQRRPLGMGASGTAILSALPLKDARQVVLANAARFEQLEHPRTVDEIWSAVIKARDLGYAVGEVQEITGVRTAARPILGQAGEVYGVVSVSALSIRLTGAHLTKVLASLAEAAAALGTELENYLDIIDASSKRLSC